LLTKGIGIDQLPDFIKNSSVLTGNNLGRLANVERIPSPEEVRAFQDEEVKNIVLNNSLDKKTALHLKAKQFLEDGKITEAWLTLLQQQELV
jgi:hypothetical protein